MTTLNLGNKVTRKVHGVTPATYVAPHTNYNIKDKQSLFVDHCQETVNKQSRLREIAAERKAAARRAEYALPDNGTQLIQGNPAMFYKAC